MDIKTLLANIQNTSFSFDVNGLSLNSQTVQKGDLFVALQGNQEHGYDYIEDAISNGCVAVLVDGKDVECSVPSIRVDNLKSYLVKLAKNLYPKANNIKLIAVTGTNGKTSVCHFISQLATSLNIKNGVIGTLGLTSIDKKTINTTPDIFTIYSALQNYINQGMKLVVIEASSHALVQGRLEGLTFIQGIFTNLTQDHLDFHKNMKSYKEAKGKLFNKNSIEKAIINLDDDNHSYFLNVSSEIPTETFCNNDFSYFKSNEYGFICKLNNFVFELPLIGNFNLSNALAAYKSIRSLGYEDDNVIPKLTELSPPPGRMQKIPRKNIWIDYAHTPDALLNVLKTLKFHYPDYRIRLVFGCGGDRDKTKRQIMGKIASANANSIIITNDNPRSEKPEKICDDILAGIKVENDVQVILDRRKAITSAVQTLGEDEVLLIAGKGHEEIQIIGSERLAFSDYEVAINALI
ncbi:UDP-N-acetylmuramoyl-L-alanyl-D-glutamate--2,6-diaminopimelate ligase [Candidatus Thioglobus sp. NP1]|uniref:UDP-N-acetylmuramoyl-L-alanyl-D-glutamate--2, 6-diaminopimelate ligase n=1 Tax=Candidatus Thioglobus sp. NP1 TaxID=2508687 RepID=UPI000DEDE3D7|nr:UDP-N-acetylmuramoyl-L-alanyl-D-glutamate--2,6-diaminopimelate ligase [Candidatus Thioglobus sp. NP1]AXE61132.1 UDP-N-acetylmuramoyl-L-alanyl-D-glutamate--2,6-diaminopimelate ligase [Candidatus Thioglobus sp. NP1]